ncbi:hypothetical protein [Dictyobacter aurantiacus]|uniref:Uncharacterized protein n=1 Tax=Dictyobacter aurantiacus TaxID=1936993 RepID=A0A401ZKK0_9CHLR|nr:hypothetical protein [Dictyobacter aurantiacus]GCE07397.1 hypothetical protein KDAU_47260 [Dictyobacter aurantiacus]
MGRVPEVERAEQILDRVGERIGALAARSTRRVQQFGTQLRARGGPETKKKKPSARKRPAGQQQMKRAEAALDTLQERLSFVAGVTELQFRRTASRVREGTEDIMAEAQNIRHHPPSPKP